jgi:hypothetical protein
MYGEFGYAAAYVHLFYVLLCVESYVDCLLKLNKSSKMFFTHGKGKGHTITGLEGPEGE